MEAVKELGVVLEPLHPGVEDIRLAQVFKAEVSDPAMAEKAISRFQSCSTVEAAYLKPPDELPGD